MFKIKKLISRLTITAVLGFFSVSSMTIIFDAASNRKPQTRKGADGAWLYPYMEKPNGEGLLGGAYGKEEKGRGKGADGTSAPCCGTGSETLFIPACI